MASASFTLTMRVVNSNHENHSELIKLLQFLDILSQRIDHLVKAHERIMTLHVDSVFKYSFLHLQYFQFEIVAHDLLHSLSEIQLYIQSNLPDEGLVAFFESSPTISDQVQIIRKAIKEEAGLARLAGMSPLTTRQIAVCSELYTMASERIVLDWFLATSTNRNTRDLLAYYHERIKNDHDNTTELF
jgi:hypothetical protein